MNAKLLFRFILMGLMLSALVLAGCDDGDDGRDGRDGADGASAYEIAVENGFDGTEQEWLDSLQGEDATLTGESCNVCHGVSSQIGLAIDEQHPEVAEKPIVSIYNITRTGDLLTVYINAVDSEGDPVEGVGLVSPSSGSDLRVYMADIVPAGTVTANSPVSEWTTAYPERWAADRGNTTGVVISEPTPGNYVFQMVTPVTEIGGPEAPEGDPTHKQRVYVRVDPRDFGELNRSIAVADFDLPADGGSTGPVSGTTRTIVAQSACTSCHGDPLQRASHGGGYQTPQVCVMCHSPIGSVPEFEGEAFESTLGDEMQASGFWLAALIHGIHTSQVLPGWIDEDDGIRSEEDFSEVTYPQNIAECSVCHFDDPDEDQDLVDNWKTNPSAEACNTCHNVDFTTGDGHGEDNIGGPQENANCTLCHPAEKGGVGGAVAESHEVDYDADNLLYETTISLSPDADNDGVYIVGETILVTTTVDYPDFDYLNEDTDFLREATLYVYGPRALAVPVLTPGSTTDPDYVDPEVTPPGTPPDQGRGMLITAQADDPLVMTDASGFKYQLLEITEGMEGTYMVQSKIDFSAIGDRTTDGRHIGPRYYPLDGWQLVTFQVVDAQEEDKVAGECTGCHEQRNFSTYAHRSYFGTDGCLACHDQSGNHADPLTNRVHAVHAANTEGDLTNVPGEEPSRVWDEITFPRTLNQSCDACHNSGNDGYRAEPNGSWGFACYGCHAGLDGIREHMEQSGAPFPEH